MHIRGGIQAGQDAVRNTQDCEAICVQTIQYCLDVGGAHAEPAHLRLMQDCSDVCETSTKVMLRGSTQHEQLTVACANLCDLCAASCEKFVGDAQMKACANQCRLCASACRQMVAGMAGLRGESMQGASYPGVGAQGSILQGSR